jgi:hypothetical protein
MEAMNASNRGSHGNEGPESERVQHVDLPYWKRAHRSWWFWIGLFLMLTAITVYVLSDDLAFGLAVNA